MTKPVRVRYAPSPTGYPHVGNIRTALFNWLFARHNGGSFIVRIEDTDVARRVEGAEKAILEGLRWLGLDWDEGPGVGGKYGPYFQSERVELYRKAARRLVLQGDAYYCYCPPERLEAMRKEQVRRKQPPGYDRHCRDLGPQERAEKEAAGVTPVVRFRTPLEGQTRFSDLIWGDVVFENSTIDDLVLLKSDGYPTYHLANVIDDNMMEISHVLRAEEWLSSTPRHVLLYQALDEYRELGYLPEAMVNFLALLGWSLDDKTEVISHQGLVDSFSLERISRTAAIFNHDKLSWMNGVYIRSLSLADFTERALPFLDKGLPPQVKRPLDDGYVRQIMPLVQERARTLVEVPELVEFFFTDGLEYDAGWLIGKNMTGESSIMALEAARQRLEALEVFDEESLEALLRPLAGELGLKTGQLFGALRTAVTGRTAAPPLFQTMAVLGKERCLSRIDAALNKLLQLSS